MTQHSTTLIEKIESLSPRLQAEVEQFVDFLRERDRRGPAREPRPEIMADLDRARASMCWIQEHRAEYAGQWVVMDGARLIAHGPVARTCFEEAERLGIEAPFLAFVEPEAEGGRMGGWV